MLKNVVQIMAYMSLLEKRFPDAIQVITIGKTYENHDIKAIKVCTLYSPLLKIIN